MSHVYSFFPPCPMSLRLMSHVGFKKSPCHHVQFKGRRSIGESIIETGPFGWCNRSKCSHGHYAHVPSPFLTPLAVTLASMDFLWSTVYPEVGPGDRRCHTDTEVTRGRLCRPVCAEYARRTQIFDQGPPND